MLEDAFWDGTRRLSNHPRYGADVALQRTEIAKSRFHDHGFLDTKLAVRCAGGGSSSREAFLEDFFLKRERPFILRYDDKKALKEIDEACLCCPASLIQCRFACADVVYGSFRTQGHPYGKAAK